MTDICNLDTSTASRPIGSNVKLITLACKFVGKRCYHNKKCVFAAYIQYLIIQVFCLGDRHTVIINRSARGGATFSELNKKLTFVVQGCEKLLKIGVLCMYYSEFGYAHT